LSHWPIAALPNYDSGAIEVRRRAFEAAFETFNRYFHDEGAPVDIPLQLEALEIALDEARETLGLAREPDE
jgi:hypothetical protein